MTLERASERVVRKPWGKTDLRPWSELGHDGAAIGEVWFQRAHPAASAPALLLKLLFTDEMLSIQVHPDDAFARTIGLPHGKTEAWYVLSATPDAQVALGLKRTLTPPQLRAAIEDGSIADLVSWQSVQKDDALLVSAGTIHAIGAGLVIAEIQQRSDTTFRLFDYGRKRELQIDAAVGSAVPCPAAPQIAPERLTEARLVLARSDYFVLEQVQLAPNSYWEIDAESETWLLIVEGEAKFEALRAMSGEAVFIEGQSARVTTGPRGAIVLMAYVAKEPNLELLQSRNGEKRDAMVARFPELDPNRPSIPELATVHPYGIRQ
ncbi:MAG: class I mannose-6-phosphate isomerase [Devosia sp.]